MKLRNYLAVLLAVSALVLAPTGATAGGNGNGGGGGGGRSGDNVHKCQGSRNCNTNVSVLSNFTLVNAEGSLFEVTVDANRPLTDSEITLIKLSDVTIGAINGDVCSVHGGNFDGQQCSIGVGNAVLDVIVNDFSDIYVKQVTVVVKTILGTFTETVACLCFSKK